MAQAGVVQVDRRFEEILHFQNLAHERAEQTQQEQHGLADDSQPGRLPGRTEDQFGEAAHRNQARSGEVPRAPVRFLLLRKLDECMGQVGHEDELMRLIDWSDHGRAPAVECGVEDRAHVAELGMGAVKIGSAH